MEARGRATWSELLPCVMHSKVMVLLLLVLGVQRDETINGFCGLMEGGSATCSLLSGASCTRTARNLFGWSTQPIFMFWMSLGSFLPPRAGMIWMSPARVMFLKHEVRPPELIIVIQLTTSLLDAGGCADVRHNKSGRGWQTAAARQTSAYIHWLYEGENFF